MSSSKGTRSRRRRHGSDPSRRNPRFEMHRSDLTISVRQAPPLAFPNGGTINPLKMVISAFAESGKIYVEVSGTLDGAGGARRSICFNVQNSAYKPMPDWVRQIVDATLDKHDI